MFDDMSLTYIKKKIRTRIVPQGNQITLGCCRYVGAFKQFEPRGLKVLPLMQQRSDPQFLLSPLMGRFRNNSVILDRPYLRRLENI